MKNTLERINRRLGDTGERIRDLKDRIMEITQSEQQKEKQILKNEKNSLRNLWDNIRCTKIHNIGVPEGEEREKGVENVFVGIMAENFPNLDNETDIPVQETQRVPNSMNPRRIIIKMAKVREKAAREKQSHTFLL